MMPTSQQVNILMVDDQPGKLLSYQAILDDLGENLISASSGKEALDVLLKNDVAVILMDVSMPELNGFELAEMIHQHPRFQKTAIIFISAVHLTDLDRIKGYQRGAMDYISVPVVPELLRAKVSLFADLYRKTRELELLNSELEQRVLARTEELHESAEQIRNLNDQLQQRVAELESIMQVLPVGVWVARDPECRVIMGNDALHNLLEVEPGRNVSLSADGSEKPPYEAYRDGRLLAPEELPVQLAARTGKPVGSFEMEIRHKNGKVMQTLVSANPLFDENGNVRGAVGALIDITERKQMEGALRKSERFAAMGRMAGIVAHEINNPLGSITNVFYLLREHPSLDDEARNYARLAEQELERITHITKQTLGFYREPAQAISVSIPALLDDIFELQSRQLKAHQISVYRRYRTDGMAQVFPGELKQVFLNLILNAIEAMPDGGRLHVHVGESQGTPGQPPGVRVSISDSGAGIQPEDAKRLFEPFFSTKLAKGTGLGLWISQGIVQKHEGTIRFRTARFAGGNVTCFSVRIPASSGFRMVQPGSAAMPEAENQEIVSPADILH